jgi:hypothetical protein
VPVVISRVGALSHGPVSGPPQAGPFDSGESPSRAVDLRPLRIRTLPHERPDMDELVKELMDRAGLSEEQAKAAAEVAVEWVKDEDKRKKILAATIASTVASAVVTVGI